MIDSNQLQEELNTFYGTESYYHLPTLPEMQYTDGVQYFAKVTETYWFITIVGTVGMKLHKKEKFIKIAFIVTNEENINIASIQFEDGNCKLLKEIVINYTHCPIGTWEFFLTNNVLYLPTEY